MNTPERSSSRIIHISDVHCTTRDYTVDVNWGAIIVDAVTGLPLGNPTQGGAQDTRIKCQELVTFLTSSDHVLRTDKIVITGDVVDSALSDDFDELAYAYLFDPLRAHGFDVTVTPGNHDYFSMGNQFSTNSIAAGRRHFFEKFAQYSKAPAPDGYPIEVDLRDGNRLILLDSLKGHFDVQTGSHRAQGNIGAQQMDWLRRTLPTYQESREGGTKVALALHHSPFETSGNLEITDAAEFLEVIAHRVDALMFGHTGLPHQFYPDQARDYDIPVITSENIEPMSSTGYLVSVVDLSCNHVEVYSTTGGLLTVEASPGHAYGSRGEAALIRLAME